MQQILTQSLIAGSVATLTLLGAKQWHPNLKNKQMTRQCFLGMFAMVTVGTAIVNKLLESKLPAFAGLGESADEIDKNIQLYQAHIVDLKKVISKGSPAGQQAAAEKLKAVEQDLAKWVAKRETV